MGRSPCCDEVGVKKGPWTPEEDEKLMDYIRLNGHGTWRHLPRNAGLNRCGKSCRLRWANYLRPDIKRGKFTEEEDRHIIHLHSVLGNKWSMISTKLPGRTDNEIKNYWNTHLKKKLLLMGIDPVTHCPRPNLELLSNLPNLLSSSNSCSSMQNSWDNILQLQSNAARLAQVHILQSLVHVLMASSNPNSSAYLNPNNLLGSSLAPLHCQLEAILHGSLAQAQGSTPVASNIVSSIQTPANYQLLPLQDQQIISEMNSIENNQVLFHSTEANSSPSQVSASPENTTLVDQKQEQINSNEISAANSESSTPFDPWDALNLSDPDADHGWKDILEQISW